MPLSYGAVDLFAGFHRLTHQSDRSECKGTRNMFSKITPAVVLAAMVACPTPGMAKPKVTQMVRHYTVSATTIAGLKQEMRQRGPNGFWAFTEWYVRWTGSCRLSVEVTYTMPKHANPGAMPAAVRQKWDAMLRALTAHEENHGRHGIMAAQEIEADGCRNGDAIIRKYNARDKNYDKKTRHGMTEGVVLQ